MGQHATIHGKTTEAFNGQDGKWIPVRVDANGALSISGAVTVAAQATFGPAISSGVKSADTVIKGVAGDPATFYGLICITAGTAAVYNGSSSAGVLVATLTGAAAGNYISLPVDCPNGLFLDWTSGSFTVIYA